MVASVAIPWASTTFDGMRHVVEFRTPVHASTWLAAIGEVEFMLPGHLVADIVARANADGMTTVEALTIVEA